MHNLISSQFLSASSNQSPYHTLLALCLSPSSIHSPTALLFPLSISASHGLTVQTRDDGWQASDGCRCGTAGRSTQRRRVAPSSTWRR